MADHRSFAFSVPGGKSGLLWPVHAFAAVCVLGLVAGACLAVWPDRGHLASPIAASVGVDDLSATDVGGVASARPTVVVQAPVQPASTASPGSLAAAAPGPAQPPPMSIRIPSIGVSSHVIPLGLLPDGTLQTPADDGEAGWWSGGPTPGAVGPAVIVGHVDSTAGPAVFFHLRDLKPGDLVWVTRADGATVSFVVRRLEQVPKAHFPTKEVYGPQPYPTLRLITCGGTFDRSTGHYLDNVIVFADAP